MSPSFSPRPPALRRVCALKPSGLSESLALPKPAHQWTLSLDAVDLWLLEWSEQGLRDEPSPELMVGWDRGQLQRYQKIQEPRARRRWAWTQIAMREILAGYVDQEVGALKIRVGPQGRPEIEGETPRFSLSHCEDRVLLAVDASGASLGVDLEQRDPARRLQSLVRRFFGPQDQALFDALDSQAQVQVFYRWWTQKEALAKAQGEGLSSALLRLPLGVQGENAAIRWGEGSWVLRDLGVWGEFQASIALEASRGEADFRTFWSMPEELA